MSDRMNQVPLHYSLRHRQEGNHDTLISRNQTRTLHVSGKQYSTTGTLPSDWTIFDAVEPDVKAHQSIQYILRKDRTLRQPDVSPY